MEWMSLQIGHVTRNFFLTEGGISSFIMFSKHGFIQNECWHGSILGCLICSRQIGHSKNLSRSSCNCFAAIFSLKILLYNKASDYSKISCLQNHSWNRCDLTRIWIRWFIAGSVRWERCLDKHMCLASSPRACSLCKMTCTAVRCVEIVILH